MGVERQRHGAVGDLLGDQQVAAAITEIEIMSLQMQRMAVGGRLDLLDPQILRDSVAAGAGEARAEMDEVEEPVYLGHVGRDIGRLDALE